MYHQRQQPIVVVEIPLLLLLQKMIQQLRSEPNPFRLATSNDVNNNVDDDDDLVNNNNEMK